jgi:arginyl-tRNA synthetase
VLLYQNVTVKGERIGKRLGNAIPLDELVAEVGPDVTRFFYLHLGNEAPLDFDLELAKRQSDENPVYYVQYGHARIASILRKAEERGLADYEDGNPTVLADDPEMQRAAELALVKHMLRLEEVVERVATELEPHHLPRYAMELAASFHAFYHDCPVLRAENEATRRARLKLVRAAKIVLARSLNLVGVTVPERMERLDDEQTAGD